MQAQEAHREVESQSQSVKPGIESAGSRYGYVSDLRQQLLPRSKADDVFLLPKPSTECLTALPNLGARKEEKGQRVIARARNSKS